MSAVASSTVGRSSGDRPTVSMAWTARVLLALVLLGPHLVPQRLAAQEALQSFRTQADGVFGAVASLRLQAQRVLLSEGLGVAQIAACDCLVISDPVRLRAGNGTITVVVRVHLLRPVSSPSTTVIVEALVGGNGARNQEVALPALSADAAPPAVKGMMERVLQQVARAQMPPNAPRQP